MTQIFLSHTHADKPVIEPIAMRLAEIFGQDNVFYDSWSIQPGDGIIDKMNHGLAQPDFVFFFVSAESLKSKMVSIEWQNALYASTKGHVKIVPIRVDGSSMPSVLSQNLWIDLFGQGIEVALQQIVSVAQGMNTFTPQHTGFANLTWSYKNIDEDTILVEVRASHLMEPNTMVGILTDLKQSECTVRLADGSPSRGGYNPEAATMSDGHKTNVFAISPLGGAITPKHPLRVEIKRTAKVPFAVRGVAHQSSADNWTTLTMKL